MGEAAAYKATGSLPKTLEKMLSTLVMENGLRSWQIYTDLHGISCRIRFGSGSHADHASSHPEHNSTTIQQHTAYQRKSPAQLRRENNRIIHRASKRQRISDEHVANIETERHADSDNFPTVFDVSPVCEPSKDDVMFKAPITPIKLALSETETTSKMQYKEIDPPEIYEECVENVPKMIVCSCCDQEMLDAFHICSNSSDIPEITETKKCSLESILDEPVKKETCTIETNPPKLKKLYDRGSNPYFTYCCHAVCHREFLHDTEYQLCTSCRSFICCYCINNMFFRSNPKKCCDKPKIPNSKYDKELNPK